MSDEAIQSVLKAQEIIAGGINDSFGKQISEDIVDTILSDLQQMKSVNEENNTIKRMLHGRMEQNREITEEILARFSNLR